MVPGNSLGASSNIQGCLLICSTVYLLFGSNMSILRINDSQPVMIRRQVLWQPLRIVNLTGRYTSARLIIHFMTISCRPSAQQQRKIDRLAAAVDCTDSDVIACVRHATRGDPPPAQSENKTWHNDWILVLENLRWIDIRGYVIAIVKFDAQCSFRQVLPFHRFFEPFEIWMIHILIK